MKQQIVTEIEEHETTRVVLRLLVRATRQRSPTY